MWIHKIYFFSNHHYGDMSLSSVLHRSYLFFSFSIVTSDRTNCTYSIREDLKRLDTDVILFNVAYEGKERERKKPRARNREMIIDTVWRDKRAGR